MKLLLWSAIAMSLISSPSGAEEVSFDELESLESSIAPELKGSQRFTTPDLHQKADWQVQASEVALDKEPLKGQGYSLIPWSGLDPDEWLSVERWLHESEIKAKHPDWKMRLRDDRQLELVGKILSCKGTCPIYRGTMPVRGQYLSRLLEGDEVRTEKDSVAWIFLMDGTLLRLSPGSSLSLQEINLSKAETFILARLNQGHVYWHPRSKEMLPMEFAPETDTLSLPLRLTHANQENFERQAFKAQNDRSQLAGVLELDWPGVKAQFKRINELKALNEKSLGPRTRVMMVAPNATLVSSLVSFDLVSVPGGKSFFKKRSAAPGEEFSLHLRGYTQTEVVTLAESGWYEVAPEGRAFQKMADVPATLQFLELLTKRTKSLELAREIWMAEFTLPLLAALDDPKILATQHGYTLWGEEAKRRFEFLTEYTRRIETTNLRSIDNLLAKLEKGGKKTERELSVDLYQHPLNHYLKGLKTRYTQKKTQVREMSDLQYYVWTLKNGKL